MKKSNVNDLMKMMDISKNLAEGTYSAIHSFGQHVKKGSSHSKAALFSFKGDVYQGLDVDSLTATQHKRCQKNIRILSGLFGILSPFDAIPFYRLTMGAKFKPLGAKNLAEFWQEQVTTQLNLELKKHRPKVLINLASQEYSKAVNFDAIDGELLSIQFKEKKGDQYRIVGTLAKKARGKMARYIIENNIDKVEEIKNYNLDKYRYNSQLSTSGEFVFCR